MARIVNQKLMTETAELTEEQAKEARRKLRRAREANPLRRVRIKCCDKMVRDPLAEKGDRVWCDDHADWTKVVSVDE